MLLSDQPDLAFARVAVTLAQQLDVAALGAFAGGQQFGAGVGQGLFDQPVMPLAAVGFEVGEPGLWLFGLELDVQAFTVEASVGTKPVMVVMGGRSAIVGPGLVVGRLAGIGQFETIGLARLQTFDLEVKPLEVLAAGVRLDGQQQMPRVAGVQYLDVAAVEVAADFERGQNHGHSLYT